MADRKGQQPAAKGGAAKSGAAKGAPAAKGGRPQPQARERARPQEDLPPPPTGPRPTPRLKTKYDDEVRPALIRELSYANVMQAPKVEKVIINVGIGSESKSNSNVQETVTGELQTIAGQKPVLTRAKKSIAAFKLRQGEIVGATVTLRGARMYDFLDKLISIALPRVRDFSGVSPDAFDGRGNYNLGLREQIIFPEIEYDRVDRVRGMEIAIVTSARTDDEGRRLLSLLGMPFQRPDQQRRPEIEAPRRRRRPVAARGR
jgi:large subunit ribosomal protein L5